MKVKHLINELKKENQEHEVYIYSNGLDNGVVTGYIRFEYAYSNKDIKKQNIKALIIKPTFSRNRKNTNL
jgi:hypothetical protein